MQDIILSYEQTLANLRVEKAREATAELYQLAVAGSTIAMRQCAWPEYDRWSKVRSELAGLIGVLGSSLPQVEEVK